MPLGIRWQAQRVPAIHDISTDVVAPPEFVAVAALRRNAPNPITYDGPETARKQQEAYPDLQTMRISSEASTVHAAALAVVAELGWELQADMVEAGRIEATETTAWFGFADDVVIRVRAAAAVTEVDVRSKSRVGNSDLGVNARRIREFRQHLLAKLI